MIMGCDSGFAWGVRCVPTPTAAAAPRVGMYVCITQRDITMTAVYHDIMTLCEQMVNEMTSHR